MKNLGYIASEITKGKNLSDNLVKYGKDFIPVVGFFFNAIIVSFIFFGFITSPGTSFVYHSLKCQKYPHIKIFNFFDHQFHNRILV